MKNIYLLIFVCLPFIVNSQIPTVSSESTIIVQDGNNIFKTTALEIANLFTPSVNSIDSTMLGTGVVTSRIIKNGTIVGKDINQMSATTGQVLAWSGSDWLPATASGGSPGGSSNQVQTNNGAGGFAGDADFVRNIGATSGNEVEITTSTLTSGKGLSVTITGTGAASNGKTAGNFTSSGANSTSSQTVYGLKGEVTNTGTSSTNVALYGNATGGTNNYGLIIPNGRVGIGTSSPQKKFHIVSSAENDGYAIGEDDGLNLMLFGYDNTNNRGAIQSYSSGTASSMNINPSGGNLGIGLGAGGSPTSKLHVVDNAVTTGSVATLTSQSLTSGAVMDVASTSNGAASNSLRGVAITMSGSNTNNAQVVTGIKSAVTNTGTNSTNVGASFSASGATNNYPLLVGPGYVGFNGVTAPAVGLTNYTGNPTDGFSSPSSASVEGLYWRTNYNSNYVATFSNDGGSGHGLLIRCSNTSSTKALVVSSVGNPRFIVFNDGKVALGTVSPTLDFGFGGDVARTFGMERHTTANTAGNTFTIKAGGATSGATNRSGGDLLLQAGTPTGNASSNIRMSVAADGTGGTSDNAVTEKFTILGNGKVGIGATTPLATLANSNTTLSSDGLTSPLSAHHLGIDWQASGAGGYLTALNNTATNASSSGLLIKTASAATSGRPLTILQGSTLVFGVLGSKIGMGTETPTNDLSFGGDADRTFGVDRRVTSTYLGKSLTINAGGATAGQTNKSGGDLILKSGISTGNEASKISFFTATGDASGTADRTPTEKLRIDGDGIIHQWNGNIQGEGDAEHVSVILRKAITGISQGEIFKNGVDSRFDIASGHVYNIRVTIVASIDNVGTLGTLSVGDSYTAEYQGMFKNVSGTTTLVGALATTLTPILDTNMAGASVSVTADNTNDALSVKFTPPTLAVSDTVTNVVATIHATKLGF